MKILKPAKRRFENIMDFPYKEDYLDFGDLNMHYIANYINLFMKDELKRSSK